jgi:hypothetical protein
MLQDAVQLRAQDNPAPDVYYYAAFAPAASKLDFCGGGCIAGLCGLVSNPQDSSQRACIGLGFDGGDGTAQHEVGHAHGRMHSPCGGAANPDPSYPYAGAVIGSWGYDIVANSLVDPMANTDLMGYCHPQWVSDFTYEGLYTRLATVMMRHIGGPTTYRFVNVAANGALSWGKTMVLQDAPLSEPHTLTYKDASGKVLATATGYYYPYDHLPGGYLLVPERTESFSTMMVAGGDISSSIVRATIP